MISTPNTLTPQVRDLNRFINWLDETEDKFVAYGEKTDNDLYRSFADHKDLDEKERLFHILFDDTMRKLLRMNVDKLSVKDYLDQLPLAEVVTTAALSCELMFQAIGEAAELENSYALFTVEQYIPKILHWVVGLVGDVDHVALNTALNTPLSTFIKTETND
jgi:hypothetical protein